MTIAFIVAKKKKKEERPFRAVNAYSKEKISPTRFEWYVNKESFETRLFTDKKTQCIGNDTKHQDIERDDSQPRAIRFDKRINKTGKTDEVNRHTNNHLSLSYGDESLSFSSVSKINEKSMKRIGLSTLLNWFWPGSKTSKKIVYRDDATKKKRSRYFFPFFFFFWRECPKRFSPNGQIAISLHFPSFAQRMIHVF